MMKRATLKSAVINFRLTKIVADAGGQMTMKEFCDEHIRRGWAFADLTPEQMNRNPDDIVKITNPEIIARFRSH